MTTKLVVNGRRRLSWCPGKLSFQGRSLRTGVCEARKNISLSHPMKNALTSILGRADATQDCAERQRTCHIILSLFRRDAHGVALSDGGSHQWDEFAAIIDGIFERVEAADEEGRDTKVIIVEQAFGDLLRRAD